MPEHCFRMDIYNNIVKGTNILLAFKLISICFMVPVFAVVKQTQYKNEKGCTSNDQIAFKEEYVTRKMKCSTNCASNPRCVSSNVIPEGNRLKCQYFDDFVEDMDNLECGQDGHHYICEFLKSFCCCIFVKTNILLR